MVKNLLKMIKQVFNCHKSIKSMLFISIMTLFAFNSNAQERTITGTVTGASDGIAIPGVNIIIKGSTIGTVTNIDGKFSIEANSDDVLVTSFIGFSSQEIEVGDKNEINIALEEDFADLDEVVVIGYGVQKKKLITGATAQVKGDELKKQNQTNALQAMQGRTSGVNITSESGQPGEGMKVRVRGVGTVGKAEPIYIVDGVQVGDIKHLNNSDIESIDILKDGASCAIYGAQGANGVILVTTKQGKAGQSQITFDSYYGFQNRPKDVNMLNAVEYAKVMNEQHTNSGGDKALKPYNILALPEFTPEGSADTDWLEEMFVKNSITQNYNLGVSGGTEQSVYNISFGYIGQEGIVGGADASNFERYNARINTENKLFDGRVKFGEHLTFANTNKNGISVGDQYSNSLRGAFNTNPLLPIYDGNNEYFNTANSDITDLNPDSPTFGQAVGILSTQSNPYGSMMLNNQNINNTKNFLGDLYANITIIKNLNLRTTFGYDFSSYDYRSYEPIYELSVYDKRNTSRIKQIFAKGTTWNIDNVLTYNTTFSDHKFDFMLGNSIREYSKVGMEGTAEDAIFYDLEHAYLINAQSNDEVKGSPNDEDKWGYRMLSYFGRVQYNYLEKYMFNYVYRTDGTSKFAEGNQWGQFHSVSAGWVMTNEEFMSPMASFLNFFKLRGSWGQNGNSQIQAYRYMATVAFDNTYYPFGSTEGINTYGSYPYKLANPKLIWETSNQLDIGFDARFLDSHLSAEFDWYRKFTEGWLIEAPVPATAGADPPYINGGSVINTGVELNLVYRNSVGDLNYNIAANGSYNKNEVGKIQTSDGIIHGLTNSLYNNSNEFYRAENGYPIGYFWGYKTDGVFKSLNEIADYEANHGKTLQSKPQIGDMRFVDTSDDKKIDSDDKTMIGDPNPDFTFGFSISLDYKAFDFSMVANGVAGNQIVQSYRSITDMNANYTEAILNRWSPENPSGTLPRVDQEATNYAPFSDIYIQDGDYLRLSNITLGFDVTKVKKINNVGQLRIYASVQNLYTLTGYDGMDPEVGYGIKDPSETRDSFSSGVDLGFYPRPRTVLFGVNVKF